MTPDEPRQALARRLRALREQHWPGLSITQQQLAEALGGRRPLSISLISSWENTGKPTVPPEKRLEAYATFFATSRSVEQEPYRVLMLGQLDESERAAREELRQELAQLRDQAALEPQARPAAQQPISTGLWHFNDNNIVTIVCAQLPLELRERFSGYADSDSPDYVALYTYADLDALIELYGHIRAVNPATQVHFKTAQELTPDDYTSHLVLLGGVDWNFVTRDLLGRVELPVRQVARAEESDIGGFEVVLPDGTVQLFAPQLDGRGRLLEDVGHFYRGPNPFNAKRTVTICNGMYGRGTLGVVRALTDARFRDRNDTFVTRHFNDSRALSIITRVAMVTGGALTPDWTRPETRLHEWAEDTD
ncbi:MAG: helix-turn-helix transcriptional regulator [Kibdelosporangium sp.]